MKIEWEQRVRVAESAPLSLVAACCQAAEGVPLPLAAHVVVTDDAEIRALNARTRGVDRATDVLSFPTVNYPAGKTACGCEKRLRAEYDPELGACLLGDIVISYPRALEQAAEYGHSARRVRPGGGWVPGGRHVVFLPARAGAGRLIRPQRAPRAVLPAGPWAVSPDGL